MKSKISTTWGIKSVNILPVLRKVYQLKLFLYSSLFLVFRGDVSKWCVCFNKFGTKRNLLHNYRMFRQRRYSQWELCCRVNNSILFEYHHKIIVLKFDFFSLDLVSVASSPSVPAAPQPPKTAHTFKIPATLQSILLPPVWPTQWKNAPTKSVPFDWISKPWPLPDPPQAQKSMVEHVPTPLWRPELPVSLHLPFAAKIPVPISTLMSERHLPILPNWLSLFRELPRFELGISKLHRFHARLIIGRPADAFNGIPDWPAGLPLLIS